MPGSPSSPAQASISRRGAPPKEKTKTPSSTKTPRSAISQTFGGNSRRISIGSFPIPTTPTKDLVSANVIKYMSGHNVSNAAKVDSSASAIIVGRSSNKPSPSNTYTPGGSSQSPGGTGTITSDTSTPPQGGPVVSSPPSAPVRGSTAPSAQTSYALGDHETIGHGFIDVNSRTAAIIEIVFGLIGTGSFGFLWIYMMFMAECYQDWFWEIIIKIFSFLGFVSCGVAIFHGCLDKRVSIGRGVFGCFVFFQLVLVAMANFVDAYQAWSCICKCGSGLGAIATQQSEDLTIFALSMVGSFSIIVILVVASVTHD